MPLRHVWGHSGADPHTSVGPTKENHKVCQQVHFVTYSFSQLLVKDLIVLYAILYCISYHIATSLDSLLLSFR